jgi:hypothetical protein
MEYGIWNMEWNVLIIHHNEMRLYYIFVGEPRQQNRFK